jgi:hypothetical protein
MAPGGWSVQQAGDTLAQSRWTKPGLYPDFDVKLPQGQPQDIYLQIRNFKPLTVPIRLVPVAQRDHQRQLELLGMSLMLGALLSLAILSALRFMEHRKAIDGWAAMFGLLVVATIAQMDGILNAFVWGEMPDLGNYASSTMPVAAIGFILLFVREVFVQSVHFRWFDRLLSIVGWSTVASILFFWASSHLLADRISGVFMLTATTLSLIASLLGWRSGSAMARWAVPGHGVPVFGTTVWSGGWCQHRPGGLANALPGIHIRRTGASRFALRAQPAHP